MHINIFYILNEFIHFYFDVNPTIWRTFFLDNDSFQTNSFYLSNVWLTTISRNILHRDVSIVFARMGECCAFNYILLLLLILIIMIEAIIGNYWSLMNFMISLKFIHNNAWEFLQWHSRTSYTLVYFCRWIFFFVF